MSASRASSGPCHQPTANLQSCRCACSIHRLARASRALRLRTLFSGNFGAFSSHTSSKGRTPRWRLGGWLDRRRRARSRVIALPGESMVWHERFCSHPQFTLGVFLSGTAEASAFNRIRFLPPAPPSRKEKILQRTYWDKAPAPDPDGRELSLGDRILKGPRAETALFGRPFHCESYCHVHLPNVSVACTVWRTIA